MNKFLLAFFAALLILPGRSQFGQFTQYFDGADTSAGSSLLITVLPDSNNIWQIGQPQKTIFNSAYSVPNVIVTDTINNYPANNLSRFKFMIYDQYQWGGPAIYALQWSQKLNMEQGKDGGIIEYSVDAGSTWTNVFNNPYVYNFYGYNTSNADTLATGEYAFSGTDTSWKDIWLCFDYNYFMMYDTVWFQFTFKSDSANSNYEGWMIDNMMGHLTIFHTAGNEMQKEYMKVYPTVTTGIVNIEGQKLPDYHIIEHMELVSADGRIVQQFGKAPVKFWIDVSGQPDGIYWLRITTNLKTVALPVIVQKQKR